MTPATSAKHDGRRSHRKSRNGCLVCKKRRVKCDEQRPQCGRCALGNRTCSYQYSINNSDSSPSPNVSGPGGGIASSDAPFLGASPAAHVFRASQVEAGGDFTVLHMSLLHHAHTHLAIFMSSQGDTTPIITTAIDSAYEAPYLLEQLLALSALHQSAVIRHPRMVSLYQQEATRLQSRALRSFNQVRENIPENHSIPAFIFATLIGYHVLHDTLSGPERPLDQIIADFVDYVRLHSGVRAVINGYWPQILESNLQPLLELVKWTSEPEDLKDATGTETAALVRVLKSSCNSSQSVIEVCVAATQKVQLVLAIHEKEPTRTDLVVHATVAWPLLVPQGFLETLYQHRPEALVVLAHYAALLHLSRDFWVFKDFGAVLIAAIASQVGPFWADALVWPQQVLADTRAGVTPRSMTD